MDYLAGNVQLVIAIFGKNINIKTLLLDDVSIVIEFNYSYSNLELI